MGNPPMGPPENGWRVECAQRWPNSNSDKAILSVRLPGERNSSMTSTATPTPAAPPSAPAGQQSASAPPSTPTTPAGPAPGPGGKARPGELRARIA